MIRNKFGKKKHIKAKKSSQTKLTCKKFDWHRIKID